jgi:hypothetical protein
MEGGSKRRIEAEWSLDDYAEIKAYWREYPPPQMMLKLIAMGVGVKFNEAADQPPGQMEEIDAPAGPSIAEIAASLSAPPIPKGETLDASREALKFMLAGKGGGDGGK